MDWCISTLFCATEFSLKVMVDLTVTLALKSHIRYLNNNSPAMGVCSWLKQGVKVWLLSMAQLAPDVRCHNYTIWLLKRAFTVIQKKLCIERMQMHFVNQ